MANINDNRVDAVLDQSTLNRIDEAITELLNLIPDVPLTDKERDDMASMDVDNKVFADDVLTEIKGPTINILPSFIRVDGYENDLVLAEQADAINAKVALVSRRVSDLYRVAANETMSKASLIYKLYQAADKAGVSGAKEPADRLKKRYERLGRRPSEGV